MDEETAEHLAGELRATRGRRRMTQSQLAERAGVTTGTVSRLENGQAAGVSAGILIAIANALDVSVAALLPETAGAARRSA